MRIAYQRRRLGDFAAGLGLVKQLRATERLPREELRRHQQARLDELAAHARARSPFWRERLGAAGPVRLQDVPVLTKREMMDRYDDLVCDPRLRRDELLDWVARTERDDHFAGEFRVMTTSGSSGFKGLFAYDRAAWQWMVGLFLRQSETMGVRPQVPRFRIAAVHGATAAQMSRQLTVSVGLGVHRTMTLPVQMDLAEVVARLNHFAPDALTGYPSVLARLAEEQRAGRLRVSPRVVLTSSELRTAEVTARIREAWGVEPFDVYACTEGLWGIDCQEHAGVHLFEDVAIVENVDAEGRPVPPGEPGTRILVTSLVNRAQPIVRLEVSDVMVLDESPCACGRTLARTVAIEGRADDVLRLEGAGGAVVEVLPAEFGVVSRRAEVVEFQVVQRGGELEVRVVARDGAGAGLEGRVQADLVARLRELGVAAPSVVVRRVAGLPRNAGGKLQLVVADRTPAAGVPARV